MASVESGSQRLLEVAAVFLRLGLTAFGGPAAHIALMDRELVGRRAWIARERFVDLLGVANLIPGPTSTELAMHIGRQRAGWPGLIVAGLAFMTPATLCAAALAALYVRAGDVAMARGMLAAVQPVVLVVILAALLPLARTALHSVATVVVAATAVVLVLAGTPEIAALLLGGALHLAGGRGRAGVAVLAGVAAAPVVFAAGAAVMPGTSDVFAYFARVGSLLFGSGYVLIAVLQGELVESRGWLTNRELLDAIAAGQATPGPVFTAATFIGFLLGGPWMALAATAGIFLPAFVFSALSAAVFDRLRRSSVARTFLQGVNAAAVALIGLVLVRLSGQTLTGAIPVVIAALAGGLILTARMNPAWLLLGAAAAGACVSLAGSWRD